MGAELCSAIALVPDAAYVSKLVAIVGLADIEVAVDQVSFMGVQRSLHPEDPGSIIGVYHNDPLPKIRHIHVLWQNPQIIGVSA